MDPLCRAVRPPRLSGRGSHRNSSRNLCLENRQEKHRLYGKLVLSGGSVRMPKDSMNDLVVLLPGITGSVLVDKNGRELWAVSGQALWNALATKTGSLKALKLAEHEPGEPAPDDGVRATRL